MRITFTEAAADTLVSEAERESAIRARSMRQQVQDFQFGLNSSHRTRASGIRHRHGCGASAGTRC